MKKMDNRVRYTKMVLQQALLKILQNKHIDNVTIKELCEEAEINRGTFYLHYNVPNDLLMEIERKFIDEHLTFFSPYMTPDHETSNLANVFASILRNKDLCRVLMGKNGNPRFVERLKEMFRESVLDDWCRDFPQYARADLSYVYDFTFAGSMSLILSWIDDDKGLSTESLARRLDRLGHYCHMAISEF